LLKGNFFFLGLAERLRQRPRVQAPRDGIGFLREWRTATLAVNHCPLTIISEELLYLGNT